MIRRALQIAAWFALAAIIFVTISPIELRPHDVLPVDFDRGAAFAVLSMLFVLAYPRSWFLVGIAIVVGAGGIELLQELSPTRHARVADSVVKAAGASIGVLAGWGINTIAAHREVGQARRR